MSEEQGKFLEAQKHQHEFNSQIQQLSQSKATTIETQTEHVIDLEDDTKILSNYDLQAISNLLVYDEVGNRHKIGDIWSEFKTIFVFVRVNFP